MTAIAESITAAVADLLAEITEDNGYPFDASVVRLTQLGDAAAQQDGTIVLHQRDRVRDEPDATENGSGWAQWIQQYTAVGVRRYSDSATTAADAAMNEMAACIEQALMANPTLEGADFDPGLVLDTVITGVSPIDPTDGAYCGAVVSFQVHYRHPRGAAVVGDTDAPEPLSVGVFDGGAVVIFDKPLAPASLVVGAWTVWTGTTRFAADAVVAGGSRVTVISSGVGTPDATAAKVRYQPVTPDLYGASGVVVAGFTVNA